MNSPPIFLISPSFPLTRFCLAFEYFDLKHHAIEQFISYSAFSRCQKAVFFPNQRRGIPPQTFPLPANPVSLFQEIPILDLSLSLVDLTLVLPRPMLLLALSLALCLFVGICPPLPATRTIPLIDVFFLLPRYLRSIIHRESWWPFHRATQAKFPSFY